MRPFTVGSVLLSVLVVAPWSVAHAAPLVFDNTDGRFVWPEGHFSPALGDQFGWHTPDHAFVGTRFTLDDGVHFGFMEVELIRSQYQVNARPLRWGYESEPGVPFAMSAVVPEPAAGLLIPAGCALLRCRARGRRSH